MYNRSSHSTHDLCITIWFEDPPLSAQLFLREEIEERRIQAVQDLMDDIPNFHISSAGSRGINAIVSIRGLTNTLVFGNAPISI